MSVRRSRRDRVLDGLLGMSLLASTLGLVGLVVTIALGFEEPNQFILLMSACLLPSAPLAVVMHASLTDHLTRARKRTWLRAFRGPRAVSAMSRYLRTMS
jgi:hypothetical protein